MAGGYLLPTVAVSPYPGYDFTPRPCVAVTYGCAPSVVERVLTLAQYNALGPLCRLTDCNKIRLGDAFLESASITLPPTIYLVKGGGCNLSHLAHEVTHIVQYDAQGPFGYYARGYYEQWWLRVMLWQGQEIYSRPVSSAFSNEPFAEQIGALPIYRYGRIAGCR